MKSIRILTFLSLAVFSAITALAHDVNAPLNEKQIQYLTTYEVLRAALAADDLAAAQKVGPLMIEQAGPDASADKHLQKRVEAAGKLAKAATLAEAREAFKILSKSAVHLATNKKEYYVAHCPMVPDEAGDWVQTTLKISNPYMGKAMPTCGTIEK